MEGCDDQESVCSSNDREGDAFPKAFERDLVTPTNLQKAHAADSLESGGSSVDKPQTIEGSFENDTKEPRASTSVKTDESIGANVLGKELRSLEERRRSLLDHHWAVPSKEK